MDKKRVSQIKAQFDLAIHSNQEAHIEFWYARDLMPLLGYERWENFAKAIGRAVESCETSGIEVSNHFREVTKMVICKANISNAFYYYFHRSFHNQLRISISFSIALVNPS